MASNNDYKIYRAELVKSALGVLKAAIDRRFPPDEVVDSRLSDLEMEVSLLIRELTKEK